MSISTLNDLLLFSCLVALATRLLWAIARRCVGRFTLAIILQDLLLFSCLAAFVTGIVIAAASLL